jgi:hypothetical protein
MLFDQVLACETSMPPEMPLDVVHTGPEFDLHV